MRRIRPLTLCSMLPAVALILTGISVTAEAGYRHWGHAGWSPSEPAVRTDGSQVPGGCPIESPGGLYLYTVKGTGQGEGINVREIWVNARQAAGLPFDHEDSLNGVNALNFADFCPTPLPDGELLFVSNRGGACGNSVDIFSARDNPATGWSVAESLGCHPHGPNTPGTELAPSLIRTVWGTFLFYSTNWDPRTGEIGDQDIYVSYLRGDGTFSAGKRLGWPINTKYDDQQPNVSQDGREIVFASNRPSYEGDESGFDIFTAKRRFVFFGWRRVTNLSETVPFDTVDAGETRPALSWDGERLYYGSGGVWISERDDYRRPF